MGTKEASGFGGRAMLVVLAAMLVACGGDNAVAPTPPPTPVPPPPPPRVVSEGSGTLEFEFVGRATFLSPLPGRLDATVNWTFDTNDLDVYLAKGDCSFDQFFDDQCEISAFSESATAKPERVSVAGATTGTYTLFVGNFGPEDESLSWQVVLTPSAAASAASSAPVDLAAGRPMRVARLKAGAIVAVH